MDKSLVVDPNLCTGCRQCEIVCSYLHEGVYWPAVSRVRLVRFEEVCANYPVVCAYCDKPPCEEMCPTGAMTHDAQTGFATVVERKCIGCKECLVACPLGIVGLHPETKTSYRCDLCGGDPACVKVCTARAIRYEPLATAVAQKRRARAVLRTAFPGSDIGEGA